MAIRIGYPEREKLARELEEALVAGNTERIKRARSALKAYDKGGARPDEISMAKAKTAVEDGKTQHQRFVEAAREYGATENPDAFRRAVRALATARIEKKAAAKPKKVKKAAKKRKRK